MFKLFKKLFSKFRKKTLWILELDLESNKGYKIIETKFLYDDLLGVASINNKIRLWSRCHTSCSVTGFAFSKLYPYSEKYIIQVFHRDKSTLDELLVLFYSFGGDITLPLDKQYDLLMECAILLNEMNRISNIEVEGLF